jgi:predicted transposase/invertase (TIGR01784 family)
MNHKAKIREAVKRLNPIDDPMFCKLAEDPEFCQEILRVILGDENLTVLESVPQWIGKNLQGRSVQLDAKCVLGDGRQTNIEVQRADQDDHQRRARYHASIMTTNIADPGIRFKEVPNVCTVYITRFDLFRGNSPVYHISRVINETGEPADNGYEEIYVNAAVKDGSAISELMEIFVNDTAYNSKYPKTSEGKRRLKETQGGRNTMHKEVNQMLQEIAVEMANEMANEMASEMANEKRAEGIQETLFSLVNDNLLSIPEAARRANITESDFTTRMALFSKAAQQ